MERVGLLLSGCGRYDGTDVHEAVLALLALDKREARVEMVAPGDLRCETVDHATGQRVEGEERSALAEAARIAGGRIQPLSDARPSVWGALIIPGGQGVARVLMRGAGARDRRREADPETASLIRVLVDRKRPIGAISLAGSLIATVLGQPLDEDPFSTPPGEIRVDEERGIVWTPGYMGGDAIGEIARGIDRMVEEVLRRASEVRRAAGDPGRTRESASKEGEGPK